MLERTLPQSTLSTLSEIVSNIRKQPSKDLRVQKFREQWIMDAPLISREDKDQIGVLWMTEILGVSKDVAKKFIDGDPVAYDKVGLLHAGVEKRKDNIKGFWEGVNKQVPDFISKDDLKFLIKEDFDGSGAWEMLCTFEHIGGYDLETSSGVIRALGANAHVYK